jgi:hypothetical protein
MRRITGFALLGPALVLAACNSIDPTLGVQQKADASTQAASPAPQIASAPADPATAQPPANAAAATQPSAAAPANTQVAAVNRTVRLNLAPIVGAPVSAVSALSHRLQQDAWARGIAINGDGAPGTTHILKGYFSTLSEGGATTVLYVWDVLDQAGNRLHRIQGQEKIGGSAADPWTVVAPQTMEAIADATIQALVQWINSTPA